MITAIQRCRLCGNTELVPLLDLGYQALTGVFPKERGLEVTSGPLRLVKCHGGQSGQSGQNGQGGKDACGLAQLEHTFDLGEMYGNNYGYRSGLNASMVTHLRGKVEKIRKSVALSAGDLVIDIGSNDSTTLQAYPKDLQLVGIDPTGVKFHTYYPAHIRLIPDFFTKEKFLAEFPKRKAKAITSFSMFYDLPDPLGFMKDIAAVLAHDGIWVSEQSYMPTMLQANSFDTICQEHLEYYALKPILWAAKRAGLKILDVEFNDVNGGSFSFQAALEASSLAVNQGAIDAVLAEEARLGLDEITPYQAFAARTAGAKTAIFDFLNMCKRRGDSVLGLGASTKGNVLLQYCGITQDLLPMIGDVNVEKYGCFTPGTRIPIVPESEVLNRRPDYLLVLPWHFRNFFLKHQQFKGRKIVFPLPQLEVIKS